MTKAKRLNECLITRSKKKKISKQVLRGKRGVQHQLVYGIVEREIPFALLIKRIL